MKKVLLLVGWSLCLVFCNDGAVEAGKGGGGGGGSSGGGGSRSYSSGGSRSYSSGGSRSYSSGSGSSGKSSPTGKSYSSGSGGSPTGKSYSSGSGSSPTGKSYSSGSGSSPTGKSYSSGSGGKSTSPGTSSSSRPTSPSPTGKSYSSYDSPASRAQREAESRAAFQKSQMPQPAYTDAKGGTRPIDSKDRKIEYMRNELTHERWVNRELRQQQFFGSYYYHPYPVVYYSDPYSTFFWLWLLDRSLEERALWSYHHRADMDEARYRELLARDARLEARVRELEAQKVPVDPSHTPAGIEHDLMYSDDYVDAVYNPEPDPARQAASPSSSSMHAWSVFVVVLIVIAWTAMMVWLVFFKRWG